MDKLFMVDDPLQDSFESRLRKTWMRKHQITEQDIDRAKTLRKQGCSTLGLVDFLGISNVADDCLAEALELLLDRT